MALTDRIDSTHAPHPSNESERLLFRQLYETLIQVDCLGRAVPGLADSWRLDTDGRTWIVTLRENAHFSDGTPVKANDIVSSWTPDGIGDELRRDVNRVVRSVVPINDRELAITLVRQRADAPMALAHPDLAIARRSAGSPQPLGTRPATTIRFLVAPGDPRDLLDQDIDLLLTRDPAALDYAATLPQFQSLPLPWQRTHVLLTPGRARPSPSLTPEARQILADDAVRGEARGAQEPFWWQKVPDCDVGPLQPRNPSPPIPRIVYDANDAAGHDLAERFVGLGTYQRAIGLTGEALAVALRRGADAAYVLSVDARPLEPCRDLQALMDNAPWLDPETIVALVDTRLRAIVRRGRSGATVDWDGGLHIAGVNGPR